MAHHGFLATGMRPFKTSSEILHYYREINNGFRLNDSQPMVLTHNDLIMRNVIVGRDGKLWLVDWEWTGFYPPYFEQIAMMSTAENE